MTKTEVLKRLKELTDEIEKNIPEEAAIRIENQFGDRLNEIVIENMITNPTEVILSLKEEWQ